MHARNFSAASNTFTVDGGGYNAPATHPSLWPAECGTSRVASCLTDGLLVGPPVWHKAVKCNSCLDVSDIGTGKGQCPADLWYRSPAMLPLMQAAGTGAQGTLFGDCHLNVQDQGTKHNVRELDCTLCM